MVKMKEGAAFTYNGIAFGPIPQGWSGFSVLVRPELCSVELAAVDWFGGKTTFVQKTVHPTERNVTRCLYDLLAHFKSLDALDILRRANGIYFP